MPSYCFAGFPFYFPNQILIRPTNRADIHEQLISTAEWSKLNFAERDQCKPVLLRLSLARNLENPVVFLYGTEWRERGYGLWAECYEQLISTAGWSKLKFAERDQCKPFSSETLIGYKFGKTGYVPQGPNSESIPTLPPYGPKEGHKWFSRFPTNESPRRTGLHLPFRKNPVFNLPAFEISRSYRTASERNSIMPCAVKSSFKTGLQILF
jgi:hypothetical protein